MSIQPKGEALRQAVKWVSEERKLNPDKSFARLIDEACLKFDLSPKDAKTLTKLTGNNGRMGTK